MKSTPLAIALATLRGLPADPLQRVGVADYTIPRAILPNGLPRPSRIVSSAALTVGGSFRVQARIIRQRGGMALELAPAAFDMARQEPEPFRFSSTLARSIYNAMAQAHIKAQARGHAQSREGRN